MKQAHTQYVRIVDLDVDIGADAVDYKYAFLTCYYNPTNSFLNLAYPVTFL